MSIRRARPARRRWLGAAWAVFLAGAVAAGAVAVACSSGPEPHYFDGASLGACTGDYARPIRASECTGCSGSSAYALCNGNTFNVCTCDVPRDYSTDAGELDAVSGPPVVGLVDFDAHIVDICCSGKLVFELPASECPARCSGEKAYAVCVDEKFSACSCEIPPGYKFSDLMCDAGDY